MSRQRRQPAQADRISALFRANSGQIAAFLRRRVSHDSVDDLVSEVFHRALVYSIAKPEADISPAWLFTVARNLSVDQWRRHQRAVRAFETLVASVPVVAPDHQEYLSAQASLSSLLQHLTPTQRNVILLRYVEGVSAAETGELLGMTPNAVDSVAARARRRLLGLLEGA